MFQINAGGHDDRGLLKGHPQPFWGPLIPMRQEFVDFLLAIDPLDNHFDLFNHRDKIPPFRIFK